MSLNAERYYELTQDQARYLIANHYLSGTFADACRIVLRAFAVSEDPPKLFWSDLDDGAICAENWLLCHLCQLGLIVRTDTGYESTSDYVEDLLGFVDEPKGLTEVQLRALLAEREALGDIGEQLALTYECRRLLDAGYLVEAHCIRRISKHRVNAGYDIESFDGRSPTGKFDRFIEVKASQSKDVRFYWSENEMQVARRLGSRYWIYYFGGVDRMSGTTALEPILYQDPLRHIMGDAMLTKVSQGLFVNGKRLVE